MNVAAGIWPKPRAGNSRVLRLWLVLWLGTPLWTAAPVALTAAEPADASALDLKNRLELFVDRFLVERLRGTELRLHEPVPADVAIQYDQPWEGAFCGYVTVLHEAGRYRMYYRGLPKPGKDGSEAEVTCYAESTNGIHWDKPRLGLFEVHGTRENNVVLAHAAPFSHNFSPFIDTRPGTPGAERYKALAGTVASGLFGFVSGDGVRWRRLGDTPLIRKGAFDSQNVGFWSETEHAYLVYLRTWSAGEFAGYRTVSRAVSTNFTHWSDPVQMQFDGAPPEHLYTSQTHPYFRAPHIYLATAMRFVPGRKVLTDEQAARLGVAKGYASDCADTVLLTSRGGDHYQRTFMEALIRPGPDLGNWASRAGLTALGVVPTGPAEISLYKQAHYAQPTAHLVRYRLRVDGFASVHAGYEGGEMITRPLVVSGRELVLNFATSAAGSVRVELLNEKGTAIPRFSLAKAVEMAGDDVERVVSWKAGPSLESLAGKTVRLRVVMKDADLYSLRLRR